MTCHSYIFFDSEPTIRAVPEAELRKQTEQFAAVIEGSNQVKTFAYTTLGFKAGTRFMLWVQANEPEELQEMVIQLMRTPLSAHLKITYTLFGLVRRSQYSKADPEAVAAADNRNRYLCVYPFTKTQEWYFLTYEQRKNLMIEHMKIGHKFPSIQQLLLYAYGVDDHEFVLSYETDNLADFQTVVMELRGAEVRRYTAYDVPVYTCIHRPLREALQAA
jgi:chlorite dismutase